MEIENDGPEIKRTTYFESLYAMQGLCFLSWYDSVARILLPDSRKDLIPTISLAKNCIISRIVKNDVDSLELLFDNGRDSPLQLTLDMLQSDRLMSNTGGSITVSVWTSEGKLVQCAGEYRIIQ
jgi:hypothetical protein